MNGKVLLLSASACMMLESASAISPKKPLNIVYILADDMECGDLRILRKLA